MSALDLRLTQIAARAHADHQGHDVRIEPEHDFLAVAVVRPACTTASAARRRP